MKNQKKAEGEEMMKSYLLVFSYDLTHFHLTQRRSVAYTVWVTFGFMGMSRVIQS